MDLGTTIVGATLLVMCVGPFILVRKKQLTKRNKKLQALHTLSQEHNCTIQEYEFCNDFVLGIDKTKKTLFFYKQSQENTYSKIIDLQTIEECTVVKKTRNINDRTLSLIQLNFINASKKENISITIYNEETDLLISNELLVANKWSLLINSNLKK
ncbi:hypothetical protein C7448_103233 [Tenacibaculum gallaicum]|uniref:Uncharacterized protein n=1 Tax=Tenacibaculum gallaicum TaxID=561505 RepID=A0A3E0I190_9FLAO|nr:hypothetical protein [Tenacibaculum gallaicum]REH52498.1 hypothetical protein C7448_103233 [Tenacibaculum gallaicum]